MVGGEEAGELLEHSRSDLEQFLPRLAFDGSSYFLMLDLVSLAADLEAQCLTDEAILWLETLLSVGLDWRLRGDALNNRARLLADAAEWERLEMVMREHEAELDAVESRLTPRERLVIPPATTAQGIEISNWSRLVNERARFSELRGIQRMELGILDLAAADLRAAREAESSLRGLAESLNGEPGWLAAGVIDLQNQARLIRVSLELQLRILSRRFDEAAASALAEAERLNEAAKAAASAKSEEEKESKEAAELDPRIQQILRDAQLFRLMAGIARSDQARLGERQYEPEARELFLGAAGHEGLDPANRAKAWIGLAELSLRAAQGEEGVPGSEADQRRHLASANRFLELVRTTAGGGACLEAFDAANVVALEGILGMAQDSSPDELVALRDKTVAELDSMLTEWDSTPPRKGGIGYMHMSYRRMLLRVAMQIELAVDPEHGGERALTHLLRAQQRGTLLSELSDGGKASAPTLGQIREDLLSEDKGLLILLPSKHGSLVFTLDGEGPVVGTSTVRDDELEEPMAELRKALQRPFLAKTTKALDKERRARSEEARAAAKQLRDLLLPPEVLAELHSWNAVTVVGSEYLDGIPIEVLPLDADGKEPLGLHLAVDVVPSLPAQWLLRERAARAYAADDTISVLAAAYVPELLGDDARKSRATVMETLRLGSDSTPALYGVEATPEKVLEAAKALDDLDYLHLFVHGTYDFTKERGASLELSTGVQGSSALVDSDWVESNGVAGRLVFLSACGSATGPPRMGDDNLAHLGGAFLVAGAECVILSRSDLELEQTLTVVGAFHESLAAGASPAEAMRRARSAGLSNDPTGWAAFSGGGLQVFGHGHAPIARADKSRAK